MVAPVVVAPVLFAAGKLVVKGFELTKSISSSSGLTILDIPAVCAKQAHQLYSSTPKQPGTTVFFGHKNPSNTSTYSVENIPDVPNPKKGPGH